MTSSLHLSGHDDLVRSEALRLLSEGYEVRARIEGWFEPPDMINGYRPDIVATKDDSHRIVEVEKGKVDWPKLAALEQFVNTHPGYELTIISPEESRARRTGT